MRLEDSALKKLSAMTHCGGRKSPPPDTQRFVPRPKGTTFLRDNDDPEDILPRPLPKGITYVANFTTYNDLMDRNILQVDEGF